MPAWYESHYTGLFSIFVRAPQRPHDPSVYITAGQTPPWFEGEPELGGSGAGWNAEDADQACVGEAIERLLARALPGDGSVATSWDAWPLDEPAIAPHRWILFDDEQYKSDGFPFAPLTSQSVCRWACCRAVTTGEPMWVPEELVYILPRAGESQRYTPGYSTGLSCGRVDDPVLLRGAQEVVERDALVGGWWGRYEWEEWPLEIVRDLLGERIWQRVERPNLEYRFYRIGSPYSDHVTLISVSGIDREGWVFSVGSACRETIAQSWQKALLEAIQGRHCVRRLLGQWVEDGRRELEVPTTFFEHALFYALNRQRLALTPLSRAVTTTATIDVHKRESLSDLQTKLGNDHPILFRNLTPPGLTTDETSWLVLRVVVPGLQPLHGDHRLPFLGGPHWRPRRCADWSTTLPHPFA